MKVAPATFTPVEQRIIDALVAAVVRELRTTPKNERLERLIPAQGVERHGDEGRDHAESYDITGRPT